MLLDLVCYDCVMLQVNKGNENAFDGAQIQTPFEQVNNSGIYDVNCSQGHVSKNIINNINFEILFEYGLNAILDGYYREAVSSITSSMERYFEFFIKVVLRASKVDFKEIDKTWKKISNQSERQLGAYIMLFLQTFQKEPELLSTNKEIPFRNSVIHKGYIPTKKESIDFANSVMKIMENSLINLKTNYPNETNETFDYYGYNREGEKKIKQQEKELGVKIGFVSVNIMTTIDVKNGREKNPKDGRKGNVDDRLINIQERRTPRTLTLLKDLPKEE